MKKAISLAAVAALAVLAIAWVPRQDVPAAPTVDQAQLDAQIDARLHTLLGKMIREAQADSTLAAR